jgi:hypothetical protein
MKRLIILAAAVFMTFGLTAIGNAHASSAGMSNACGKKKSSMKNACGKMKNPCGNGSGMK